MTRPRRTPLSRAVALTGLLAVGSIGAAALHDPVQGPAPAPPPLHTADSSAAPAASLPARLRTLGGGAACPLSPTQERNAVQAFKKLLPVVLHPRCQNCHGGVDPFVDEAQGRHGGGKIDTAGGFNRTRARCQECHDGLPGWELPVLPEMGFVGKSPRELCMQFKRMIPTARFFVGHIFNENGKGPRFTETAYKGDRALNEAAREDWEDTHRRRLRNEPPPGSHAQVVADAQAWTDAMGDGYPVLPDCGCKPHGSAWEGTVKAWWELRTAEMGILTETSEATVRFVIDSSYDTTDDIAEYWKSVSGTIKWQTSNVGGQCRVSASGSLPIGLGADSNPMASLREEQGDISGSKFSVGIGPWPDAYVPVITWQCKDYSIPSTLLGVGLIWWNHDATGMVSPDGETMKGTYRSSANQAVMSYEWDLHLVP